jgi:hypothetical protein
MFGGPRQYELAISEKLSIGRHGKYILPVALSPNPSRAFSGKTFREFDSS